MYNKRLVFLSTCLGMLLFGISLTTLGSVVSGLSQKFDLDEIASGTLFSILPFGILTGSLIFGPLCDKYGYKYLLFFAAVLIFIGFEGIAYAPDFTLLRICIFLFGLGGGAINGGTNALAADVADSEKGKSANLSLLGVFFGFGALGMPFVLGLLAHLFTFQTVIACVGGLALLAALCFMLIDFPLPKHVNGFPIKRSFSLLKDPVLIFIAFFLFCQSSFEAIVNNWITTYLMSQTGAAQSAALYALSLFVAGMTAMRLLMGSVLKNLKMQSLMLISLVLVTVGCVLLNTQHYIRAVAGLVVLGAGLAGGFPAMLGVIANRYKDLSATAFSIVLFVAMFGNMLINYVMGVVAQRYGIQNLIAVAYVEIAVMTFLGFMVVFLLKKKVL